MATDGFVQLVMAKIPVLSSLPACSLRKEYRYNNKITAFERSSKYYTDDLFISDKSEVKSVKMSIVAGYIYS